MQSMYSSCRAFETISLPMSLSESHHYDINGLSDKDKFNLLSPKSLDYIDQHCTVSIHLEGIYIPPELRRLLDQSISGRPQQSLDHLRPLSLCVITQDLFSFEIFKNCVTKFLSQNQESDQINCEQGNWIIRNQDHRTTVIIGYVFDGIEGYDVPSYVFENQSDFIRCLREQYQCLVSLSYESSVFKSSSKLTVTIIHESPITRHFASVFMQKSMMASVTQCEMYHLKLILRLCKFHSSSTSSLNKESTSIFLSGNAHHNQWSSSKVLNLAASLSSNNSILSTTSVDQKMTPHHYALSMTHNITNAASQDTLNNYCFNRRETLADLSSTQLRSPIVTTDITDYKYANQMTKVTPDQTPQFEIISNATDEEEPGIIPLFDQRLLLTRVRNLQHRFYLHGISIGEEFSRITSILNISPHISLAELACERKIATKKKWFFSLLLDDDLILAQVCDSKKNEAKRCAYDTMIHLLISAHQFALRPVENNKWKVINVADQ